MQSRLFLDWMNLGFGYDLLAGERREASITLKEPKKVPEDDNQNNILEATEISSYNNLISTFNREPFNSRSIPIECLREWSFGKGFGIGAEIITFLDSFSINRYSIFLLIKAAVKLNNRSIDVEEINLSKEATEFLKNNDPKDFRDRYGDESIVAFTNGGIYLCILEIATKSKQERQEIISNLKPGGTSKLEMSNVVTVLSNIDINKIKIHNYQRGGDRILGLTKIAEIVEAFEKFSNSVNEENALPLFVSTIPYGELVAQDEKRPLYARNYGSLLKFADECSTTLDDVSSLQYVIDHQHEFIISDKEIFDKISNHRRRIKSFLSKQYEDAHNCFTKVGESSFSGGGGLNDSDYPERK